jgi:hypothetical protein
MSTGGGACGIWSEYRTPGRIDSRVAALDKTRGPAHERRMSARFSDDLAACLRFYSRLPVRAGADGGAGAFLRPTSPRFAASDEACKHDPRTLNKRGIDK